jgi:hypothetical protein
MFKIRCQSLGRNDNLDKVVVNGLGTRDNPDRFYIVMTNKRKQEELE